MSSTNYIVMDPHFKIGRYLCFWLKLRALDKAFIIYACSHLQEDERISQGIDIFMFPCMVPAWCVTLLSSS